MPTVKLKARYGTWYRSDSPKFVFYNFRTYLAVRASGPVMHSYLYFTNPFPTIPGVKVTSAKLRLWMQGGTTNTGTRTISVQRVGRGLNFTTMTYDTRPTVFAGPTSSVQTTGPLSAKHMFELDVTADLAAVAAGATFYGYIITTTAPFTIQLYGANGSTLQPELQVDYTVPPSKPRDLSPAMGRAVGLAKPYLTFNYYDTNGSEKVSAVQVQTNPTNSFTTPAWDSGEVATPEAALDLADTTHPGVAANATMWWRVRAKSAAGVWSLWSDPTSFVYRVKPTVTMTNPGATFTDPTPPITWTYSSPTGSAQKRWRAALYVEQNGRWVTVDHSGERVGADTAWTPTKPASFNAYDPNARHRAVVDVWDSYNREETPGDRAFASASRVATFQQGTGVVAPTGLAVALDYPRPDAVLTWARTETPDFWAVYRDGKLLERLPGPDLAAGGTSYTFRDFPARGAHTWTVRAIVNGQTSAAITATATVDFKGTWLFDDEGRAVCIQDDRDHDMTMPEVSALHEPLGSDRVVVITQALRGYEGNVSGLITELKGQPEQATTWRANLLAFKSEPTAIRTLVIEDQAFPVIVRNVQLKQAPKRHGWLASFEYYQQGGLLFAPLGV